MQRDASKQAGRSCGSDTLREGRWDTNLPKPLAATLLRPSFSAEAILACSHLKSKAAPAPKNPQSRSRPSQTLLPHHVTWYRPARGGQIALGAVLAFDNLGQDEAAAAGGPLRSTRLELSERIPSAAARLPPLKREGARPRRLSVPLAPKAGPGQQPRGSEPGGACPSNRRGLPVEAAGRAPSAAPRRQVAPADQERAAAAPAQVPLPAGLPRATAGCFSFVFLFFLFFPGFFQRESCCGDKTLGTRGPALPAAPPGPALHGARRVSRGVSGHPTPRDSRPSFRHPGGTARRRGPPPREMLWYGA